MGSGYALMLFFLFIIPLFAFLSRLFINKTFEKWQWIWKLVGISSLVLIYFLRFKFQIYPELNKLLGNEPFDKVGYGYSDYNNSRTLFITGIIPFDLCPILLLVMCLMLIFSKMIKRKWFMVIGIWAMFGSLLPLLGDYNKKNISDYLAGYIQQTHILQYGLSFLFIVRAKANLKLDLIKTKILIILIIIYSSIGSLIFRFERSNIGIANGSWIIGSYSQVRILFDFGTTNIDIFFIRMIFWLLSVIAADLILICFYYLKKFLFKYDEEKKRNHFITNFLEKQIDCFEKKVKQIKNNILK